MENFVPFLKTVADDLVGKNGESRDFSKLTIVFPNKRARLFLNKHLIDAYNEHHGGNGPLWSPEYVTSSNLLEQFARYYGIPLSVVPDVDKFQLVQLLYNAYLLESQKKLDENPKVDEVPRKVLTKTIDEFYFLGEIILNDFDDIDKNLVDAKQLFRNFKEMKDLENLDYLTESEVKAVQDFLKRDFNTETALFKGFITLWELLGDIYTTFKTELEKRGIAYAGMLHRMVAEKLDNPAIGLPDNLPPDRQYVFVGFNALNKCEASLLKKIEKRQLENSNPSALFYWDYDTSYFDPKNLDGDDMKSRRTYRDDAGTFMRNNLGGFSAFSHTSSQEGQFFNFPDELKSNPECHNYLRRLSDGQRVRVLSSSTDTAQTKYVSKWISELKSKGVDDSEIAIVLCDEKLLPAVLHSIPTEVEDLNVTMGFPVTQTPAYSFAHQLLQLQLGRGSGNRFTYGDVVTLLRHSIVRKWKPMLVEPLLRLLKEHTKFYILPSEIQSFVNLVTPKKDVVIGGKTITVESIQKENEAFVNLLFDNSVMVKPEASAQSLTNWLIQVMRAATVVYSYNAQTAKNADESHNFTGLYEESYYQVFRMVNCLMASQQQCRQEGADLSVVLFSKLMNKMFASAKVPYSGEPAKGLQIMGFLETRSLDFKYLLMLSVGEKYMPKDSFAPSFIPYALRVAYKLPAVEHEDALYAYNFFRLLQRPEHITLTYNAASQNTGGEQSRFLRQLKQEYNAYTSIVPLSFDNNKKTNDDVEQVVEKSDADIQYIRERYAFLPDEERKRKNEQAKVSRATQMIDLSPSALNSYLDCSLRFYFHYIKHLSADDEFDADVDEAFFGRIFHKTMELIYCEITGHKPDDETVTDEEKATDWKSSVCAEQLKPYENMDLLKKIVDKSFAIEFHVNNPSDYTGIQLIKRNVLAELVHKQIMEDVKYAGEHGFIIYKPEYTISQPVEVELRDNSKFTFRLGGVLDRRDLKDCLFRVVDYKTGGDPSGSKRKAISVDALFEGGSKRSEKVFQATLYSCLWNMKSANNGAKNYNVDNRSVQPVLMFPRQMNKDFSPALLIGSRRDSAKTIGVNVSSPEFIDVEADFMMRLKGTLRELLDKEIPFRATNDKGSCAFCDFKSICHREDAAKK